jgi:hypothetical protein
VAYNDQKIVNILLKQCESLEERCPGYRKEMLSLVAEVLNLEREHALARTNVAQRIGDQVNTLAMVVYGSRKRREH